jgi:hypothetical protein
MRRTIQRTVLNRLTIGLCSLLISSGVQLAAQTASLQNGTLILSPGTSIRFLGDLELTIDGTADLVNNGLIVVGTGRLNEPNGSPITGTGIEHAWTIVPTGTLQAEPGGLGLTMTGPVLPDTLTVERGHQPIVVNGDIFSVARWYRVLSSATEPSELSVLMQVDQSELNGIEGSALELHRSDQLTGPWAPLISVATGPPTAVSASLFLQDVYLTAFESDVMTGLQVPPPSRALTVWPTIADATVHITCSADTPIRSVELFSTSGALAKSAASPLSPDHWVIQVADLASGTYVVRVNGIHHQRIVRP